MRCTAWLACLFLWSWAVGAEAQVSITGLVIDRNSKEPLIGVSVFLQGNTIGTTTDAEGYFVLNSPDPLPVKLMITYMGYETRILEVSNANEELKVELKERVLTGAEVVVSTSRFSESILKSPLSIDKIDILEVRSTPSADVYGALANLRGVQANTSSLTFTSMNTRGFADVQNWRFIQLIDGAEMNAPGLNYPVGALSAPADVDVQSMELVPGASSALYGANAFNGMLAISTKNPFLFTGLSAEVKTGMTWQQDNKIYPMGEVGLRYAWAHKDKFAMKFCGSVLTVRDWGASDDTYLINNAVALRGDAVIDSFLNLPRSSPQYDAVNRYGDEVSLPLILDGQIVQVSRTGIAERDIINYRQQVFKAGMAFHYKINKNLELIYDGRFVHGDAMLRHTTIFPLVDFWQQVHKLELNGGNSFVRAYYSLENAGNSYSMLFTGAYIQERLKPTSVWAADYALAYNGGADNVPAGDHQAARDYADRDMPAPGSELFLQARAETLDNPNLRDGGSKFVDKSSFFHVEGNYDFTPHWDVVRFQVGGSFRRYNLVSQGLLFNDGPQGFNGAIPVYELGGYVQASKSFLKEAINLRASGRVDKNFNFPLRITPRASAVFAWGKQREHNLRLAYQQGFRNPAAQETFVALDIVQSILLGGTRSNIDNYQYTLPMQNPLTLALPGTTIDGNTIYDNLVTMDSYQRYLDSGDKNLLQKANLQYLRQERVTSFEIGYRALIKDRIYLDANYYYNIYNDFVTRVNTFSVEAFRMYSVYANLSERITSMGAGITADILLPKDFKLGFNYSYTDYDARRALESNPNFLPSFNMPRHRFNVSLGNRNVAGGFGFNIKYRWNEAYVWQSPFGEGRIPSAHILDAALFYRVPAIATAFKLGATNLLRQNYRQVYGGPNIGSQIYLSISYDPVAYGTIKTRKKTSSNTDDLPAPAPKKSKKTKRILPPGSSRF